MSDAVGIFLLSPTSYLFITGLLMILVGALIDIVPPKTRSTNHLMWLVPVFMFYGLLRTLSSFELYKVSDHFLLLDTALKVATIICALEFIRRNLNSIKNKDISTFIHIPLGIILTVINSGYQTNIIIALSLLYTFVKLALLYGVWYFSLNNVIESSTFKKAYGSLVVFLCISQALLFIAIQNDKVMNFITIRAFNHIALLEYLGFLVAIALLLYLRVKFDSDNQKPTDDKFKTFIPTFICLFIGVTSIIGAKLNENILLQNEENVSNQVETSANNLAKEVDERIEFVSTAASIISNIPTVSNYFETPNDENLDWINKFLEVFNLQNPDSLCFLLNNKGMAVASSHQAELIVGYDFSFRRYYRRAISGQADISLGTGLFTRIPGFYAAETIRSLKSRKILGVAVVKRNLEDSAQIFKSFHPAMLFDNDGTTLISSNNRLLGLELPNVSKTIVPPTKVPDELYDKLPGFNKNYWYATLPIKGDKWQIMVLKPADSDGHHYWLLLVILLITYILIAIMHGISRNNEYLYEYEAAQKQFKLLFDYAPDSVFVLSAKTQKITKTNHQTNLLFAHPESMIGIPYYKLLDEEEVEQNGDMNNYSTIGVFKQECKLKKFTGEKFVGEITGSRILVNGEESWMMILHDITTHKKIERQLKDANSLKERFFANASHEIRTPMTAIIGLTELAVSLCNNDRQRHTVELIRSSAKAMLTLINDILDLSELESGKFQLNPMQFNLHLLLMDLSEIIRYKAPESNQKSKLTIDNNVPETIIADPERIKQISLNLIDNALEHNPQTKLEIGARAENKSHRDDFRLILSIVDKKRFLTSDEIENHFSAFSYTNPHNMKEPKTSNLGLAIVKQMVGAMDGSITIDSNKHDGTSFVINLLVKKALSDQSENPKDEILAIRLLRNNDPLRFLIADDNEINLFVASSIIEKYRGTVVTAKDGEEVLKILTQDKKGFDCLLIDIQMPKLDGIYVIQNIRNSQASYKDTPIVAISAFASHQEALTVRDMGAEAYLNKPYFPEDLIGTLKDILDLKPEEPKRKSIDTDKKQIFNLIHINQSELELRLLKQPGDIIKICEIYDRRYDNLLTSISASLKSGNSSQMREVAHSIRGLAEMLSAKTVAQLATKAEGLAKSGNSEEAAELLRILKNNLTEINTDLQSIKSAYYK